MSNLRKELEAFSFKGQSIPTYMHDGLIAYFEDRRPVGNFLTAVLMGDLFQAFQHADSSNFDCMPTYVAFLHHHAPYAAYGSKEKVHAWLDSRSSVRQTPSTSATGVESHGKQEQER